jgi:hypothetical protein
MTLAGVGCGGLIASANCLSSGQVDGLQGRRGRAAVFGGVVWQYLLAGADAVLAAHYFDDGTLATKHQAFEHRPRCLLRAPSQQPYRRADPIQFSEGTDSMADDEKSKSDNDIRDETDGPFYLRY